MVAFFDPGRAALWLAGLACLFAAGLDLAAFFRAAFLVLGPSFFGVTALLGAALSAATRMPGSATAVVLVVASVFVMVIVILFGADPRMMIHHSAGRAKQVKLSANILGRALASGFSTQPPVDGRNEVGCHDMRKKVIVLPTRKAASAPPMTPARSRIVIHVGAHQYAMDITCQSTVLPPEPTPAATPEQVAQLAVQTRFLRLSQPAVLGDRIDGWRVCWIGGWDKGKVLFVVMVERVCRRG